MIKINSTLNEQVNEINSLYDEIRSDLQAIIREIDQLHHKRQRGLKTPVNERRGLSILKQLFGW